MGSTLKGNTTSPPQIGPISELAAAPGIRECLQFFAREKHWITEQHLNLCRIAAPTFLEQKRAEWMVAQFRSCGCEARIDRGGNVVAQLTAGGQGPYVAVTAHLDTVLAPRKSEDIRVEGDGTLRGPGVSDNGAGLAALLALARALKIAPRVEETTASVLFVANVGEEGEGNLSGMRYLCRQSSIASRIRAFLVLDGPSTDHITSRALASRRYEIAFSGSGGHSWSDFGTASPVHALSRTIAAFADVQYQSRDGAPRTSFNFGTIEGGSSITSIPTEARAKVDLRSESPDAIEQLAQALTACVERAVQIENERSTTRVTARLREIGSRPGGALADDASILHYVRAADAYLGIRSQLDCASTDANVPLSMNVPAISVGAGGHGGGAHTPSEWYHPEAREQGLARALLILAQLLREP